MSTRPFLLLAALAAFLPLAGPAEAADYVPGEVSLRDPGADDGLHGLLLVAQIATAWGCSPTSANGKVVWATLRCAGARSLGESAERI